MISAIIILTVFGVVCGFGLAIASKKFAVEKDPKVEKVLENLPGVNCGACGYPGCAAMSEAIASGRAAPNGCPVCSPEMISAISVIMGVESVVGEKRVPRLLCGGGKDICKSSGNYAGPLNCKVMNTVLGGGKGCRFGCMGGGDCAAACPVSAIIINEQGLPVINEEKCISCEICVKECPRNLLSMKPISKKVIVECASTDKGPDVRAVCSKGCIACMQCVKVCPESAITVDNFLAFIDPQKCILCGKCVEKCPTKAIRFI